MRAIRSAKQWRKNPWRVRAVQLALAFAGVGLTAIAAAAIGGSTKADSDGAMAAAIVAQRIADGQSAQPDSTSPADAASRAEILQEATRYESDMKQAIAHTDQLRLQAYHDKDLIRTNFIMGKLEEMRTVLAIAQPSLVSIRQPGQDLFVMRAKLSTIRQGWEQVKDAMASAETATSDSPDFVNTVGTANGETNPNGDVNDPTGIPIPTAVQIERPSAASPYK